MSLVSKAYDKWSFNLYRRQDLLLNVCFDMEVLTLFHSCQKRNSAASNYSKKQNKKKTADPTGQIQKEEICLYTELATDGKGINAC